MVAYKHPRRIGTIIDRAKCVIAARKVSIRTFLIRRQTIGNFTASGNCGRNAFFSDDERRRRCDLGHQPSGLDLVERRYRNAGRCRVIKGKVKLALCFGQPRDPAVRKGRVPFVPKTAKFVFELCSSGQFERLSAISSPQAKSQRRFALSDLSHFSKIFERTVGASDGRAAIRTNEHDGRTRGKFDGAAA